jgi:hypothetical protein
LTAASPTNVTILTASHVITLTGNGTDSFNVRATQTSGGNLNVEETNSDSRLGIMFVGVGIGI